ncbi:FAD-dependent thymidylate synthase [Oscillatoria sp. HE19RPO]|uniref:FAD-dependent thymidylate synthase n=1 Tax=Oscillatoria sp. HE19RPO TaxID=2954806 RepID=UPI0020C2A122|nr:FAD-dependent thymidylate synthase [Oscillatoria sp. HE19RPO]
MDRFRVEVITKTPNPQQVIYAAMHQDYSEGFVYDDQDSWPSESKCGELIVKRLLAGERGHYGPIEHVGIVFNCGFFPHSVMQQIRTHRVGISFDVQCLAGDTEVTFLQAGGSLRKIKIAELYDFWANGEKAIRKRLKRGRNGELPGEYRRDCKTRLKKMRLRVLNETTGFFEIGHIKDVIAKGIQPVYRVTLDDGKTLDCTTNHRLFTAEGWQRMGEAVGLVTNEEGKVLELTKSCDVMCNGISVLSDRLERNTEGLEQHIYKGFSPLEIADNSHYSNNLLQAHPIKVKSVQFLGLEMTYDLEVEGPWHNFVANGMVVHNSNRYTGNRIVDAAKGIRDIEDVFYLRPVGYYTDRQGKRYEYTQQQRDRDLAWCLDAAKRYQVLIEEGTSEEHARGIIPFDVRQHWVVSFNARSLMHLLDLRAKPDAQLECQKLCDLIWPHFQEWVPAIAEWYEKYRLKKGRLSP